MQINKYSNKQIKHYRAPDIHERIYKFVISVIRFTNELPKNPANNVIIHQVIKSATSMGANDQEADGTQSKKDFIVKKETKETNYWLQIISDTTNTFSSNNAISLRSEGIEILKIVSTIIINTKRKI